MPELSPTRATALQSEIRHFAGWHLAVHCPRCRMLREVQMDDLIKSVGAEKVVGDVVRRLRCQDCGTAPIWVKLADGVQGTARVVRSVMVVG
jgi:phage FluMu protein Com